jgi:hypothetical protein
MDHLPFRIVQPWGRDRTREATIVRSYWIAEEAYAALDAMEARPALLRLILGSICSSSNARFDVVARRPQ